jgi:hypothetical protein
MGIRFRRTVRLVPGVRLNFSRSGVSTTIGRRGATMTFGKHGTHLNVGLPGTGLSYRTQISPGPEPSLRPIPTVAPVWPGPGSVTVPVLGTAIRSDDAAVLTTPGLDQLKTLINETADQRQQLESHLAAATRNFNAAKLKLALAQAPIIRLFTKDAIPRLALAVQVSQHQVDTLEANLDACHVDVDFAMDAATTATWSKLRASFEILSGCSRIWDITATARVDQWRERTMATTSIARSPIRFGFASDDVIRCGSPVFQLGNVGGRDLNIFPAFLMLREANGEFGLVEFMNVTLELGRTRFVETEGIPADSQQLGVTWHKANKDGSRDRRFAQNYQIPIAEYGELLFRSPTGLLEAYLFSSYEKSRQFYAAFKGHVEALRHLVTQEVDPASLAAAAPDTEAIPMPPLPRISTSPSYSR